MSISLLFKDLENEARLEFINVLENFIEKKEKYWWEHYVLNALLPHQQVYIKEEDFSSLDLNCLVSIFVFNNKSFLERKLISSLEYKDLAMKIRYIRNTVAHLPGSLEIQLTSEKIIYFLMAYKLFFRNFHDLYSSDQPLVFKDINKNLKIQMIRFLEAHNEEVDMYKKLENESDNNLLGISRKIDMIYENLNQKKMNSLEDNDNNISYDQSGEVISRDTLNFDEAKDILVGLRENFRREYKDIPREEGILTNSIINFIIENKVFEKEIFLKAPFEIIGKVNKRQFEKIEDILSVMKRVKFE